MKAKTLGMFLAFFIALWGVLAHGGLAPSQAANVVTVPNVARQDASAACKTIEALGLRCQVEMGLRDYPPDNQQNLVGKVSRQQPNPGSRVAKGSLVRLVKYWQRMIGIPNLINWRANVAEQRLRGLGLQSKVIWTETRERQKHTLVYDISPAKDSQVRPGQTVTLRAYKYVTVIVPELRGMSYNDAFNKVAQLGLKGYRNTDPRMTTCDPRMFNVVAGQLPTAGTSVGKGSSVTIIVYQKAVFRIPGNIMGMSHAGAQRALGQGNLRVNLHWASTSDPKKKNTVANVKPGPGQAVECGSSLNLWVYR